MIPKYCPNCGASIQDDKSSHCMVMRCAHVREFVDDGFEVKTYDAVYDVYCPKCGWSGDISPDSETNIENKGEF